MNNVIYETLEKMNEIHYGWIDKYKVKHTHSKQDFFKENYRFMSVEETLDNKIGTCFEQSELVRHYLNESNISCKNYIIIYNTDKKIASHTICVANIEDKYYLMETSWIINDKNIEFSSVEEILNKVISLYPKMYKLEPFQRELIDVYEYTTPETGITFKEFQDHARGCNKIDI